MWEPHWLNNNNNNNNNTSLPGTKWKTMENLLPWYSEKGSSNEEMFINGPRNHASSTECRPQHVEPINHRLATSGDVGTLDPLLLCSC